MQDSKDQHHLQESLGLLDATMIVSGSMIGSGIFIVTAAMARDLGASGYILSLWILSGLITVIAALSYGELAGMMPKAGGQFVYIQKAYGNLVAFLYGWTVFAVIQTGVIAAVAVAFAKFAGVFFPAVGPQNILFTIHVFGFHLSVAASQLLAIALIVFLTFINSLGIRNGKIIQFVFTSAKILALAALIICGFAIGLNSDTFRENFHHAWDAFATTQNSDGVSTTTALSGMALVLALGSSLIGPLFSSDAWNNVTFIAGEIKNPKKNIPLSLIFGTLIVTVLYLLTNITYLALLPLHGDPSTTDVLGQGIQFAASDRVGTAAAYVILGNGAVFIMAALIMISTFGCNNGLILSGARVYYAMAKEGLFFKKATQLNKYNVPGFALVVQCIWASLLCLSGTYGDLLAYCTFASMIFYIVTISGLFVLRRKWKDAERPYKTLGYPVTPALYIIIAVVICAILLKTVPNQTVGGLIIVAIGIPLYIVTKAVRKPSSAIDKEE